MRKIYYVFKINSKREIRFIDQTTSRKMAIELCKFTELDEEWQAFVFKARRPLMVLNGRLK